METGCNLLSQSVNTQSLYTVAVNGTGAWFDAQGSDHYNSARLLLQWVTANASNNFTIEGSVDLAGTSPVVLAKPTVTAASTHLLDIVELPLASYRYFRIKNSAGSAASVIAIMERYNPRQQVYQGTLVPTDKGNIYYYTGDEA